MTNQDVPNNLLPSNKFWSMKKYFCSGHFNTVEIAASCKKMGLLQNIDNADKESVLEKVNAGVSKVNDRTKQKIIHLGKVDNATL